MVVEHARKSCAHPRTKVHGVRAEDFRHMKSFTKEEIEGTRAYFSNSGFPEVPVKLGSRTFAYFVLPQSLEPKLAPFVFRCTGKPEDGYVLGIADTVKEEHRPYAIAHEFIEFTEIGINRPNRCSAALLEELSLVPDSIKKDYIGARTTFFENLIRYCEQKPEQYTPCDLQEFSASLLALRKAIKG